MYVQESPRAGVWTLAAGSKWHLAGVVHTEQQAIFANNACLLFKRTLIYNSG